MHASVVFLQASGPKFNQARGLKLGRLAKMLMHASGPKLGRQAKMFGCPKMGRQAIFVHASGPKLGQNLGRQAIFVQGLLLNRAKSNSNTNLS